MNDVSSDGRQASTKIQTDASGTSIVVTGDISERSILVVPDPAGPQIRIDTAAVTRINSLGVANWIRYMAKLTELGVPVLISPLSVAFVSQAGMISNFLGSAQVVNFLAPYFCPDCDHPAEQLYAIDAEVADSIPCPKCQEPMEFDDEMDSYLEFRQ